MTTQMLNVKGSRIFKLQFSEIESYLEEKGMNVDRCFEMMADEKEMVYVSNGFISALKSEITELGEWHHYFKKDGNDFESFQMKFDC